MQNLQYLLFLHTVFKPPIITANFLLFYGFGAWNKRESEGGYSYARLMTITGLGADFTYKRLTSSPEALNYTLSVAYNHRKMNTEEDSYKNLFTSYTHHFKPEITLSKKYKYFHFHALLTGDNNMRNGAEHVYENQNVSTNQSLYEHVKVATNDMYTLRSYSNSVSLKVVYRHSPIHSYHLLGGAYYNHYEEKYVMPVKRILNQSISPFIGIGYNGVSGKSELEFNIRYSWKKAIDNVFSLPSLDEKVTILQTYIPYLIRGEDSYTLSAEAAYARAIDIKNTIGAKLSLAYQKRTNAPYINYLSAYGEPDRKILVCNFSLFYLF